MAAVADAPNVLEAIGEAGQPRAEHEARYGLLRRRSALRMAAAASLVAACCSIRPPWVPSAHRRSSVAELQ